MKADLSERVDELQAELIALRARVDAMETQAIETQAMKTRALKTQRADVEGLDVVLLERLGKHEGERFRRGPVQGAMTYAASLKIDGQPLLWQRNIAAPDTLTADAEQVADVLAGAGHPLRVQLLRLLCARPHGTAELCESLELSTGKLYHHLDKLTGSGWVRQPARGTWAVAPEKVTPTLLLFGLAGDLRG